MVTTPFPLEQKGSTKAGRATLLPLTSLRFVAALWVLLHHFAFSEARAAAFSSGTTGPLFSILNSGHVAVGFFFILSGFVLAYSHVDRPVSGRHRWPYFASRIARIYPLYFLSLLPNAVPAVKAMWGTTGPFAAATFAGLKLTMLQGWVPLFQRGWNDPTWSLSVEALFYLLFPFLLPPLARLEMNRLRYVTVAAFAAIVIHATIAYLERRQGHDFARVFLRLPLLRVPEFALGVLLGLRFVKARPLPHPLLVFYGALLCLLALTSCAALTEEIGAWVIPPMAVLIYAAGSIPNERAGVLRWAPFVLLGEASYGLYLVHAPIHSLVGLCLERAIRFGTDSILLLGATIVVAVATSLILHRIYEVPVNRRLRVWLCGHRAPA